MSEYNDVTPLIFGRPAPAAAEPEALAAEEESPEALDADVAPDAAIDDAWDETSAGADDPVAPWADPAFEVAATHEEPEREQERASEADSEPETGSESGPDTEPSGELELDFGSAAQEDQPSTYGHPEVDAVVERLDELEYLETADHIEIYEDAHHRLHETLLAAGNELADSTPPPDSA